MNWRYTQVLVFATVLCSPPASGQAAGIPDDDVPPVIDKTDQPRTENDIWDYFDGLCDSRPTSRCSRTAMWRAREGEIIPAVPFDLDDTTQAYKDRFPGSTWCKLLDSGMSGTWGSACDTDSWHGKKSMSDPVLRKSLAIRNARKP